MEWLEAGLKQVELDPPEGLSREQVALWSAEVRRLPFVSLVAVLAGASFKPNRDVGEAALARAAATAVKDPDVSRRHGDAAATKDLLAKVFRGRMRPADAVKDPALRRVLLQAGIEQLSKQTTGVPAKPEEIREVIRILETGRFFGDAASVLQAVFHAIDGFPADIFSELQDPNLARLPAHLLRAVVLDATGLPGELRKSLRSLGGGREGDEEGQLLSRTLGCLKQVAVAKRALLLIRALLSKDNRSARLALILYARANGITVSEDDIDRVYGTLDPERPELGLPLRQALERLVREYGVEEGIKVLQELR